MPDLRNVDSEYTEAGELLTAVRGMVADLPAVRDLQYEHHGEGGQLPKRAATATNPTTERPILSRRGSVGSKQRQQLAKSSSQVSFTLHDQHENEDYGNDENGYGDDGIRVDDGFHEQGASNGRGRGYSQQSQRQGHPPRRPSIHQPTTGLMEDARSLMKRFRFDVETTRRRFQYWFMEQSARQKELDEFREFRNRQISSAVKSEAFRNLREIKERRKDIAFLEHNLSKIRERVGILVDEERTLQRELRDSHALHESVTARIRREQELLKPVQQVLHRERDLLYDAQAAHDAAEKAWQEMMSRASQSQQVHAAQRLEKETALRRARAVLEQEKAVAPPEDVSGQLRAEIEAALLEQVRLRGEHKALKEEKGQLDARVADVEQRVGKIEREHKNVSAEHVELMRAHAQELESIEAEEFDAQQQLAASQKEMLAAKEALMQMDDKLIDEKKRREAINNAIKSATVNKQSREAEMQRIAAQYDVALADHSKISREMRHLELQQNELAQELMMDEKSAKHETRIMAKKLANEVAWHEDVENALEDVQKKLADLRSTREAVLPELQAKADTAGEQRTQLADRHSVLAGEKAEVTASQQEWEEKLAVLESRHKEAEEKSQKELKQLNLENRRFADVVAELNVQIESAPSREKDAEERVEQRTLAIEKCKESIEAFKARVQACEEKIAELRETLRFMREETVRMIKEHEETGLGIEHDQTKHSAMVTAAKEEIKERKLTTKRVVARNEPTTERYKELQRESLEVRAALVAVLEEELEKSILFQRKQQVEAYQQRYAHSAAVFWTAEQEKLQRDDAKKMISSTLSMATAVAKPFSDLNL